MGFDMNNIVAWTKENAGTVIEAAISKLDVPEQNALCVQLARIYTSVDEALADGFQAWNDIAKIMGTAVPALMSLADQFGSMTGSEKREFVVENVAALYRLADSGKDGTLNRINIPLLFGGLETKVENIVVRKLAEIAVEAVFATPAVSLAPPSEEDADDEETVDTEASNE